MNLLLRIPPYFSSDVSNMSLNTTQEFLHSKGILPHKSKHSVFLCQYTWIIQHYHQLETSNTSACLLNLYALKTFMLWKHSHLSTYVLFTISNYQFIDFSIKLHRRITLILCVLNNFISWSTNMLILMYEI